MQEPKVSVVVPVYNAERYLDRCITSIVDQTYRNLEIILVDDGSPDRSPKLCDEWAEKDRRIKVLHKENAGAGMARNTGIDHAGGQYILFVDSDDYIDLTTVEKCVMEAKATGADAVMFGRCTVSPAGEVTKKPIVTKEYRFEGVSVREEVLPGLFVYEKGIGISSCDKMLKLSILKDFNIRFYSERELISEDAYFVLELFAHLSSVSILPENLYYYFQNENSFSRTYDSKRQDLNDRFLEKGLQTCDALHYAPKVRKYFQARYLIYALAGMKQIVGSGLEKKQKKKALKAVFNNPVLRSSLDDDTIALSKRPARVFWKAFRLRCFYICYFLLWYKSKK